MTKNQKMTMHKRQLILLLCSLAFQVGLAHSSTPHDYAVALRDTTRYGEDDDESEMDSAQFTRRNYATGLNALDYVMEKRYKARGDEFTRKWYDHLFLQAGLGVEQMVAPGYNKYDIKALTAIHLGVGKQFNKYNSFRLLAKGAWGYQQDKERLFTKIGVQLDHLYSLSSYFGGYRPSRLMDVSTIVGVGAQYSKLRYKNDRYVQDILQNIQDLEKLGEHLEAEQLRQTIPQDKTGFSFEGHLGVQFRFYTGPQGYFNIEPYVGLATDDMDVSEGRNFRKIDAFYGINMNYIYYLHNNLSPQERLRNIQRREKEGKPIVGSTVQEWQHPWIFQCSNGINFHAGTALPIKQTLGSDISIAAGKWFSPVIGLRASATARQMTMAKRNNTVNTGNGRKAYTTNLHSHYLGARIEGMFNPLGFLRNFNWDAPFGAYFLAGLEYGWLDKSQTNGERVMTEAYTGGVHLWCRLSDGLHFFVEPRVMHYMYKVPYTNVDWSRAYAGNCASVSFGLSISNFNPKYKYPNGGNGDEHYSKFHAGVGGGYNMIHTRSSYEGGKGFPYNGLVFAEYEFTKIHAVRAAFEYVSMPSSSIDSYYDYNMDESVATSPNGTRVRGTGMWNHNYTYGLVSLSYMMNMSKALCGQHVSRRVEASAFLGPTLVIPFGDHAEPSSDITIRENHKLSLIKSVEDDHTEFGVHAGVKVRVRLIPHLSLYLEPTVYLTHGITSPSIDFTSYKARYFQTLNLGVQYDL